MTIQERENERLQGEFERREAGVADMMELYDKVEAVYVRASASIVESDTVYTSDSTNGVRRNAYLG